LGACIAKFFEKASKNCKTASFSSDFLTGISTGIASEGTECRKDRNLIFLEIS
jgi:hypothetical protein